MFGLLKQYPPLTKEDRQADRLIIVCTWLVLGAVIANEARIRNNHRNEDVQLTKMEVTTPQHRDVWHVEDKRPLFHLNGDFIVAQDAADSAYADEQHLGLGTFIPEHNQILVRAHAKGQGWRDEQDLMNYKMK